MAKKSLEKGEKKMKRKETNENVKRQTRKRSWLFWIALAIVLRGIQLAVVGNLFSGVEVEETMAVVESTEITTQETTEPETTTAVETTQETTTEEETTVVETEEFDGIPDNIRIASTTMTIVFVGSVVGEEYDLDASYTIHYVLDDDGDGTIEVMYLPTDAGKGRTKVNLTIVKEGDVYTIESALLAGLYEVDMSQVIDMFKTYYE